MHFVLKNLRLLSNPMNSQGQMLSADLVYEEFKKLDQNLSHRKTIAQTYAKLINPKILSSKIVKQIEFSSNLRFPIFVEKRADLIKFLSQKQIFISDIWYDAPIAPKKYLNQTDYTNQCPNAEIVSSQILNLPTHINVNENDARNISNLVNQWLKSQ